MDADKPVISVVLPVYNGAATIDSQLGALSAQVNAPDWELIVADNGSTDATLERVERWRLVLPNLRVIDASSRRGVSFARNVAIREARADTWALCDADDVVGPNWVQAMADALKSGHLVTGPRESVSLNSAETTLRPATRQVALPTFPTFLPYATGCNMGATRDIFERIGGFDELLQAGGDDIDFSWRAQIAGAKLVWVDAALVSYRHREGLRQGWKQVHAYARANPHLYVRFRKHGMRRRPVGTVARKVGWLMKNALAALLPKRLHLRKTWLLVSAELTGHLRGSWEARALYL